MGKKSQRKALAAMKKGKATEKNVSQQAQSKDAAAKSAAGRQNVTKKPVYISRVHRPFEGLEHEVELAALRELIPAGSVKIHTTKEYGDTDAWLVSIAPEQAQGVKTDDGRILIGLQTAGSTGDASHDIALVLEKLIDASPGTTIKGLDVRAEAPKLREMIASESDFEIYEDFGFWFTEEERSEKDIAQALEQMKESMVPTKALDGVRGAYWCKMTNNFVRWVRSEDEDAVLNGLARLLAEKDAELTDGARCIGAFRMLGLLTPVWQVDNNDDLDKLSQAAKKFDAKLTKAIADKSALTPAQRRARDGFISRQVSLR
ncbi:MAG: DUF5926 family protein [Actinomycetaceae bacterium]|nr:DUF5926 family protein [Actinomycetaceae bacterium]